MPRCPGGNLAAAGGVLKVRVLGWVRRAIDDAEAAARSRGGDLDAYGVLVARYPLRAHRAAFLPGPGRRPATSHQAGQPSSAGREGITWGGLSSFINRPARRFALRFPRCQIPITELGGEACHGKVAEDTDD